jgi:hypothetical protein
MLISIGYMLAKNLISQLKEFFIYYFLVSKTTIYFFLVLHEGRPSYRRSLQPSKENIQDFLDPDPDPGDQTKGSASTDTGYNVFFGLKNLLCEVLHRRSRYWKKLELSYYFEEKE